MNKIYYTFIIFLSYSSLSLPGWSSRPAEDQSIGTACPQASKTTFMQRVHYSYSIAGYTAEKQPQDTQNLKNANGRKIPLNPKTEDMPEDIAWKVDMYAADYNKALGETPYRSKMGKAPFTVEISVNEPIRFLLWQITELRMLNAKLRQLTQHIERENEAMAAIITNIKQLNVPLKPAPSWKNYLPWRAPAPTPIWVTTKSNPNPPRKYTYRQLKGFKEKIKKLDATIDVKQFYKDQIYPALKNAISINADDPNQYLRVEKEKRLNSHIYRYNFGHESLSIDRLRKEWDALLTQYFVPKSNKKDEGILADYREAIRQNHRLRDLISGYNIAFIFHEPGIHILGN